MREVKSMLKDEAYFKKQHAKFIKKDPIKFMAYIATEMIKISEHEGNERQQAFYTALLSITKKYL